jgi:dTDP-4-amino-4,6-dideoxygalactose transaminase
MECLEDIVAVNRRNYECYRRYLADVPGVTVIAYEGQTKQNYQYMVTDIDAKESGLSRDRLMEILHAENVIARRYFYPGCHRMEPYRTLQPEAGKVLPETEQICTRILCLPTGTALGEVDVEKVCALITSAIAQASEINERFQARV